MTQRWTRGDWNKRFADTLYEQLEGVSMCLCLGVASASDDAFNDGVEPEEAALEELTYWDEDES